MKITKNISPGTTKARILTYTDDLKLREDDTEIFTVTVAEDQKKYEEGVVRLSIKKYGAEESVLVSMDVLIALFNNVYAKTIKEMEKRDLRRKKMIRIYSKIRVWSEKLIKKYWKK